MTNDFYKNQFDDATQVKLEIFRRYLREWLPVFMNRREGGWQEVTKVNIYDFFAGRGRDAVGNPGAPLIIVDEMKNYCISNANLKTDRAVRMVFNDIEESHIDDLEKFVAEIACDQLCCQIEYSAFPFNDVLPQHLVTMSDPSSRNLVIMDQFGIKEVTPEVMRKLAQCSFTDILFFISTSFINRFIETPEIGSKFDFSATEMKKQEYKIIHRYICDYYRDKLGDGLYYLAPFSIKKGGNIYGVVFGTGHLLGLEKFLKVCWALDNVTGEANYNIDGDFSWSGQRSLFDEMNKIRKIDLFEKDLQDYIVAKEPNNINMNEFCLIRGFSPAKAREVLTSMQSNGKITVWDLQEKKAARKGAFYLGWDNCKSGVAKVRFTIGVGA